MALIYFDQLPWICAPVPVSPPRNTPAILGQAMDIPDMKQATEQHTTPPCDEEKAATAAGAAASTGTMAGATPTTGPKSTARGQVGAALRVAQFQSLWLSVGGSLA